MRGVSFILIKQAISTLTRHHSLLAFLLSGPDRWARESFINMAIGLYVNRRVGLSIFLGSARGLRSRRRTLFLG